MMLLRPMWTPAQTSPFDFNFNDCRKNGEEVTAEQFMQQFPADSDVWKKCNTYVNGVLVGAVAKIVSGEDTVWFKTLESAVAAAETGDTVEIVAAGTYTLPALPKNITIEGKVEGVEFDHTTAGNIAATTSGASFKNVTFNFGNVKYHGFQHNGGLNFEDCTFNGLFFTYGNETYTNCTFKQTNSDYNMWVYGGSVVTYSVTYSDCTFINDVTGKFLNVYNENEAACKVIINSCTFINNGSSNKAAVNVKETCGSTLLGFEVLISGNNTLTGAFPENSKSDKTIYSGNGLYMVDDRKAGAEPKIHVVVDCTVNGTAIQEEYPEYVAAVTSGETTTKFATLIGAFDAAFEMTGDVTVTMLADENIDVAANPITIQAGKSITLDLNGKTVTGSCSSGTTSALITNKGTLTITDSSADMSGKLIGGADPTWTWDGSDDYSGSYASNLIRNDGTLVVNGGTLYNASTGSAAYAIDNYGSGKVTINGGYVDAKKASAIRMFYCNGGVLTVNGGTIGRYNSDDDCCFRGIQVQDGTDSDVVIHGGAIAGKYALYSNGTDGSSVTITDGSFDGDVGFGSAGPDNVDISGGTFYKWVRTWGSQTGFISGGTFYVEPDPVKIAPDKAALKSGDVWIITDAVAQVGEARYASFADAAEAAAEDTAVITLLKDIDEAYTMSAGETLKVKLDGHTLTVNPPAGYALITSVEDGVTTYTYGTPVAKIGETLYASLQDALDAAHEMTGDVTVTLVADITGYSIVHQKADLNLVIDGDGKTIIGQIIIDGDGRANGTETLAIQNIGFAGIKALFCPGTDAFILVPSTKDANKPYSTGKYNYAHNITISGCSFTSTSSSLDVVGYKATSGAGDYNVTFSGITGTNLHSLAQLTGTTGANFNNCTVTASDSFVNVSGGSGTFNFTNNTFTSSVSDGYGVRLKDGTAVVAVMGEGNVITAGKALVLGKNAETGNKGVFDVRGGTYYGDIAKITTSSDAKFLISGGRFDREPNAAFIVPGKAAVKEGDMWVIGGAVAEIDSIGYATLEDAIAAVKNNETIVVLADCETADADNGKTFTIAMNGHTLTGITWVTDDTTLTLDGSVEGSAYNGSVYVGYSDNNNGNVTLNGGTYTCASGNTVLHINGTCLNSNVTIRDAKVTSPDDNGIQLNGSGTFVIENSVITGATGVYVKSGKLTITDSTITGNMSPANYSYNGNGANATGDAIIVDSCEYPGGAPVVNIGAGNTFNGTKNQVGYYEYDANNDGTTVPAVVRSVTNELTLSAGYAWAKDGEVYIVTEAVAQINDVPYVSLEDASRASRSTKRSRLTLPALKSALTHPICLRSRPPAI